MALAPAPSWLSRKSSVFDPFSMNVWDPSETFVPVIPRDTSSADKDVLPVANARIDWKETGEAHVFKADLPGLNKDEVKIEVEDGRVLQISGERKREKEEKNERWHCLERVHGRFIRRFRLPDNGNLDEIKATMENGLLTVTVPKKPQPQPAVKQIDISGN